MAGRFNSMDMFRLEMCVKHKLLSPMPRYIERHGSKLKINRPETRMRRQEIFDKYKEEYREELPDWVLQVKNPHIFYYKLHDLACFTEELTLFQQMPDFLDLYDKGLAGPAPADAEGDAGAAPAGEAATGEAASAGEEGAPAAEADPFDAATAEAAGDGEGAAAAEADPFDAAAAEAAADGEGAAAADEDPVDAATAEVAGEGEATADGDEGAGDDGLPEAG